MKKIPFYKYLHENCGYSLNEAKSLKDRLTLGEIIELEIPSTMDVNIVLQNLIDFGVKCRIEE